MNQQPDFHRILVVDDNPSIHQDFRKILCPPQSEACESLASLAAELFDEAPPQARSEARFTMDSAFQGQEGLDKVKTAELEEHPYSLAFVDVRMPPGWDGVETIKQIWSLYPHIQVVICTAYSDYSWEEILRKLGETDSLVILKKPFDNVEVLQLAHTLTKKWTLTRQAQARMADLDESVRRRTQELVEANEKLQQEIQRRSLIEWALRESEERFHKAFETVSVALAIRPVEGGGYIDVNQSFITLTGYSKQELLEKTPEQLNLLVMPAHWAELVQSLHTGERVSQVELAVRRKSGEIRQTLASIELLRLGSQSCLLAALLDISEQKQLEVQLRQAQKMEAVGQLAAGIAHDFNNLLTVIHGYASLQLAKSKLDADVAKAFTQVKLASERASSLTRQLLAFSRKQVVQRKPLNVAAALTHCQGMLSRVLGESIAIEYSCAPDLPWIDADEASLDQVMMNLAVNARDAMPNGGKLLLSATVAQISGAEPAGHPDRRPGKFVMLTVADTGCGMDQQTLSRIFEPFFTTKPVGHGTGLGLSTVYGILKQHDGWIDVESQVGQGTVFRAFLPAITTPPPSEPAALPTEAPQTAPIRPEDAILVVEDEPGVRNLINSVLTNNGYHVIEASSGAEALVRWKEIQLKVRLLITDMIMPDGVSGSMLAKRLLQRDPELRVVYTSGYSPDAVANERALQEGLNFLSKPFSQEHLLKTVRNALNNRAPAIQMAPANTPGIS